MLCKDIGKFNELINDKKVVLGIDFGEKKIGIAISNSEYTMSVPLHIIVVKNLVSTINEIREIVTNRNVGSIVIGLPLKLDGTETSITNRVKSFSRILSNELSIPIFLYDERLTSKVANNILKIGNMKRKVRNNIDDRVAANIILDGALYMLRNIRNTHI